MIIWLTGQKGLISALYSAWWTYEAAFNKQRTWRARYISILDSVHKCDLCAASELAFPGVGSLAEGLNISSAWNYRRIASLLTHVSLLMPAADPVAPHRVQSSRASTWWRARCTAELHHLLLPSINMHTQERAPWKPHTRTPTPDIETHCECRYIVTERRKDKTQSLTPVPDGA